MLFADFLNYAMDQADLTNYKLAKRIGVSQSTIANWSNGITEPREKRRSEVLALFGVDEYGLEQGFPEIHYSSDEQKEKPTPVSESGQDRNIIKIAGRDGSFVERELTDDQVALMKNMLDQLKPIDDDRI